MNSFRGLITYLIAIFFASLLTTCFGETPLSEEHSTKSNSNAAIQFSSTPKAPNPPLEENNFGSVTLHWCDQPNAEFVIEFVNTTPRSGRSLKCQPLGKSDKTFRNLRASKMCRFPLPEIDSTIRPLKGNREIFVELDVTSIVDDTSERVLFVLISSTSELPEDLRKLINPTNFLDGTIVADFMVSDDKPKSLIRKYPTDDSPVSCLLVDSTRAHELLMVAVNMIDNEPLPIALARVGSDAQKEEKNKTWMTISIILILVVIFLLLFIFRRILWKSLSKENQLKLISYWQPIANFVKANTTCISQKRTTSPISEVYDDEPFEIVSLNSLTDSNCFSHPVNVEDFEDYVKQSIADEVLKAQFRTLPKGPLKDTGYGALPQNKSKNRYPNIISYDETRVILKKIPGKPYSDYINANYIPDIEGKWGYIATQGPKPETVVDFWRMVWQEKTRIICMLANVVEGKKSKCAQYWPNYGETETYGGITIVMESYCVFSDFILRTLRVSYHEKSRKIQHLHYTSWPDHNVPKYADSVIAYMRKLQTLPIGNGPIIVHCSAGVGRTGTIILCDICSRQAVAKRSVDVLAAIKKLRDCRLNMVDTETQYLFVHLVLVELLVSVPTAYPCNQSLPQMVEELKKDLPHQMERLRRTAWLDLALHPMLSSRTPLPEQLAKNRFPELAPDSSRMVFLKRYPTRDANSDYISAVIVNGLRDKTYFASQLPMPSTLSDVWRLIAEQGIEFVVMLQQPDPSDSTCCSIVPGDEPLNPVPHLQVELMTCSRHNKCPKIDHLLLTDTSEDEERTQEVSVLTCTEWGTGKGGKPPLPINLVEHWMRVEAIHRGTGPILVLCHDGVTSCGLYLGLSFLMDQMTIDRECDVINAVRVIRRSRPDFVQSQEQFEYLYDVAATYIEHFEIYSDLSYR